MITGTSKNCNKNKRNVILGGDLQKGVQNFLPEK